MQNLTIRPEQTADISAISILTKRAFQTVEHSSHTEHFIVDALRQAQQLTLSLVAIHANNIVGHIAISPVSISTGLHHWYGLGPLSVHPQHQQHGIGSALVQHALQQLKSLNASGCVVLGDPDYYAKFGFRATALQLADVPAQYFQALCFDDSVPTGMVTYAEAFSATS